MKPPDSNEARAKLLKPQAILLYGLFTYIKN